MYSVFVGKLSWNVDTDWLKQEFSDCGEIVSASVQTDRNTGKSRGFGYVHFTSADAVQKALAKAGQEIDGRVINVDVSTPSSKTQSRENRAKTFGDKQSPPSSTLFIGNLAFSVVEDTLWNFFSEFGDVKSIRLPQDRETGNMKGFGYVEFNDIETSKKAYEGSQGQEIEGRPIRIDYSQPREPGGGGRVSWLRLGFIRFV
jgi:nucleolin